jgi:ABC-type sugar transport system substrate-binding protein
MNVRLNRREFSASIAAAATVGVSAGVPRAAESGKTIALMFDAFDSDFWITGNVILKAKAKENG